MAAAAAVQQPSRINTFDAPGSTLSSYRTPGIPTASGQQKLSLLTSSKSLVNNGRSGTRPSPSTTSASITYQQDSGLSGRTTDMASYTSTRSVPFSSTRSDSRGTKLHKRNSSGNSLPASPSPLSGAINAPYTKYDTPTSSSPSSSTPKIKPYLRKLSSAKEEQNQGRLDLSKSTSENGGALAGLGIHDFGNNRSASDVSFATIGRRGTPHMRTTSVGSQASNTSGSYRPSGTFVHPMRLTPTTHSYASSMNEDEARESSDIVNEEERLPPFRARRSISISSTPSIQPTPLSKSHTAEELGLVPRYTTSQSNLSLKSSKSDRKLGRPRGNTDRSDFQSTASPSSRTSFDRAFSMVSRRSDTEQMTEQEKIRAARRRFEEKEQNKNRKYEQSAQRKEERQRRRSEASDRRPGTSERKKVAGKRTPEDSRAKKSEKSRADSITSPPQQSHISEKAPQAVHGATDERGRESGWHKFVRAMSCGG